MIRALLAIAAAYAACAGDISGVVLDARNISPIEGATVSTAYGANKTQTDSQGRFTILNLKAGTQVIEIQKPGFAKRGAATGPVVELAAGDSVSGLTIRLTPGASISGTIIDTAGQPVEGSVTLTSGQTRSLVAMEQTNTGVFRFSDLPAGVYKISTNAGYSRNRRSVTTYYPSHLDRDAAGEIQLGGGEHKSGVTITVREVPHHTVTGRFTGEILPNTRYSVIGEKSARELSTGSSGALAPDGAFTMELPTGRHRLKVMRIVQGPSRPTVVGFTEIGVADAAKNNVIIQPSPLRTIRAKFRWRSEQNEYAPAGNIALNPMEGLSVFQFTEPGPDGWHTFRDVAPDRYSIFAGGLPKGLYVHSIVAAGGDITERGLDLITGSATELEIQVADDGGSLRGRLTNASDQPIPWTRISLIRETSHRAEAELHARSGATNAVGRFTFADIAPGNYGLAAFVDDQPLRKEAVRVSPRSNIEVNLKAP